MNIVWSCNVCGHHESDPDHLRVHIWREHGKELLAKDPALIEALKALSQRQARLRAEVFGRR